MTEKKHGRSSSYWLPVLMRILVDLKTKESRNFAPYQIQDLFWPNIINIIARNYHDFLEIERHIYLPIFPKNRFNLRFWTILNRMAEIQIMQVELNRTGDNVQRFFPRDMSVFLKRQSIETIEDFIYCKNLYTLFRFADIDSFDRGFHELWNSLLHPSLLSKIDAMNKTDKVITSQKITNIQKICRLNKMAHIFKFDTLKVSEFFGWNIYRLLTEAGFMTLKDLSDFEEIDTLIPQKHRQEFDLKFSAIYYSFCFLEEIKRISKK